MAQGDSEIVKTFTSNELELCATVVKGNALAGTNLGLLRVPELLLRNRIIIEKGIRRLSLKDDEWLKMTNYQIKSRSENKVVSLPVYRHRHLF